METDKTPHDWLRNMDTVLASQESWRNGTYREEVFAHFYVKSDAPFQIACGAGLLAAHVRKFQFSPKVIATLGRLVDKSGRTIFDESFLNHLQRLSLRLEMQMPAEGTLLLPGQPLAVIRGSKVQVLLIQSALDELVGRSSFVATQAARHRWEKGELVESETPAAPAHPANRTGWQTRAHYLGGGDLLKLPAEVAQIPTSMLMYPAAQAPDHMSQIRRLFEGNQPLADLQMTDRQDRSSSVSKRSTLLIEHDREHVINYSRFQRLYQPLLVKGHPVLASPQLAIRRQRTLHQLEAFAAAGLDGYLVGLEG
jgi:hypothetical protein